MTETTHRTKVTKLTRWNVLALDQNAEHFPGVETTQTTASFPGTPIQALQAFYIGLDAVKAVHGGTGHPVASLHAVGRKLLAGARAEDRHV